MSDTTKKETGDGFGSFLKNLLKKTPPVIFAYAIVISVLYFGGPFIGTPTDLTTKEGIESVRYKYPNLAEGAEKDIPQDGSGRVFLFEGEPDHGLKD